MTPRDTFVLGTSWLLINGMAAYGAAKFFGDAVWIYVAFIVMYVYYVHDLSSRRKK